MSTKIDSLYWELGIKSKEFVAGIDEASAKAGSFDAFMKKGLLLTAGAVSAALGLVAFEAVKMSAELDAALRVVSNVVPGISGDIGKLRTEINALSRETGESADSLARASLAIARAGVRSQEELIMRLGVVQKVAEATGNEMSTIAEGIDQVMDLFGLQGKQFEDTAAKLFQISRGRLGIEDLMQSMSRAAPVVHDLGLSFDVAANAMAELINRGYKTRQATAEIMGLAKAGEEGKKQILLLADAGKQVGSAMDELNMAVAATGESAERNAKRIRENLSTTLRELGDRMLPNVNAGLRTLLDLIDSNARMRDSWKASVDAINVVGYAITKNIPVAADDLSDLKDAWYTLMAAIQKGDLKEFTAGMDPEKLKEFVGVVDQVNKKGLFVTSQQAIDDLHNYVAEAELAAKRLELAQAVGQHTPPPPGFKSSGTLEQEAQAKKDAADRAKVVQESVDDLERLSAGLTRTLTDDMSAALDAQIAKWHQVYGATLPAIFEQFIATQREAIGQVGLLEPIEQQLTDVSKAAAQALNAFGGPNVDAIAALLPQLDQMADAAGRQLVAAKGNVDVEDRLKRVIEQIVALQKSLFGVIGQASSDATAEAVAWTKRLSTMRETQQAIAQAAQGALQMASAFGIVDANLAQALESVVQIASNLPILLATVKEVQKLKDAGGKGDTLGIITAALPVLGGVASLVQSLSKLFAGGPSPEEQRRADLLKKNNELIADLNHRIGDLGSLLGNVAGSTVAGVASATQATISGSSGGLVANLNAAKLLNTELGKLGLTMTDFREVAKGLGIEFAGATPTLAEMQKVLEALNAAELTRFATTYAGQLQAIRLEFTLFDITDPIEQLKKLQALGKQFAGKGFIDPTTGKAVGGSQVLAGLGALDLSTQAGRDAAAKALQDIFDKLQAGTLTPAQLGGLSPQELLDFLNQFKQTLDAANKSSAPQGETQGFAVNRTITEAQGSLVISLLGSVAYWQEQTYNLLASMGGLSGVLTAPTLLPVTSAGGGTVIDMTVNLTISGVLDTPTALRVGSDVIDGMVSKLDAKNGAVLRTKKLLVGDVSRL